MDLGFIGLGNMGTGMAQSLLRAGHAVTVYNRSRERSEALRGHGARVAERVADACEGAVVFTMLADDAAVEGVAFGADGILANLRKGGVHVCSSTIGVELSDRLSEAHAGAGQGFVSAPVFGRPEAAAAAKLFVVAAGGDASVRIVQPLLDAVGQKTFVVGDRPSAANLIKLSGNFLLASVIEGLGEAMALVGKGGVDRKQYLEIMTSTLFGAPVYKTYGGLIADRKFEPAGFAAALGAKDVRLTLAAAEKLRVPMPIASLLRDRFLALMAQGGEKLDWSAIGDLPRQDAGD